MLQTLHRAGDSLVLALPESFVEQNRLRAGAQVTLCVAGNTLIVSAAAPRPRYRLHDLLAEMPQQLPMVAGWDSLASVGGEGL